MFIGRAAGSARGGDGSAAVPERHRRGTVASSPYSLVYPHITRWSRAGSAAPAVALGNTTPTLRSPRPTRTDTTPETRLQRPSRSDRGSGSRLFGALLAVILIAVVAGALFLAMWDIPAPSQRIEQVLPNDRFPK